MYIFRDAGSVREAHAKEAGRGTAMGFPVDEIAPPADGLSQQEAHGRRIQQGPKGNAVPPGKDIGHQKAH